MSDGAIRYYEKFRSAKTLGPTAGSRFITEYNPKTGDVYPCGIKLMIH